MNTNNQFRGGELIAPLRLQGRSEVDRCLSTSWSKVSCSGTHANFIVGHLSGPLTGIVGKFGYMYCESALMGYHVCINFQVPEGVIAIVNGASHRATSLFSNEKRTSILVTEPAEGI